MNDEIKEKIKAYYVANDIDELLDYITNLQQENEDNLKCINSLKEQLESVIKNNQELLEKWHKNNDKIVNLISENERLKEILVWKQEHEKELHTRIEKAINDIKSYLDGRKIINDNTKYYYTNEFYKKPIKSNINYLFNDYLEYLINILQNESDNE